MSRRPRLALLPVALLLAGAAQAAPIAWHDQPYVTHERTPVTIPAEAARLVVAEDPARPDGAKVELALLRLASTSRTPGPPIVYLHGGPGGSSAEHLEIPEFRAVFDSLRTQADVILLDQRGCGASTPSLMPVGVAPPSQATFATDASFLAWLSEASTTVRDRFLESGHDPKYYTVAASVADLEALRAALGVPALGLFAHSYGTQLAQAFVRAHPTAVDRMVLVGPRGMDTSRKLPAESDSALTRIAALARADATVGADCPDLGAVLDRVLARLDRTAVTVTLAAKRDSLRFDVGGDALRFIIAKFYLNDPDNFRYLPRLLVELDSGRVPGSLVFNLGQLLRGGISFAWFTTDASSGVSAARAEQIRRQAATSPLRGAMNFPFPDINRVWAMPDAGDAFRAPVTGNRPTLVVAGTLDGLIPVAQAREVQRGFTDSRLLLVTNGGHTSQLRAPHVAGAIAGFFAGRVPPESDALPPPAFVPLVAGAPAGAR